MNTLRHRHGGGLSVARELLDDERGDVPGWVLVTLVTVS